VILATNVSSKASQRGAFAEWPEDAEKDKHMAGVNLLSVVGLDLIKSFLSAPGLREKLWRWVSKEGPGQRDQVLV